MGRQNQTKPDISEAQQAAISALLAGSTTEQAAAVAGVTRQTVSGWRNHDVEFCKAYHRQRAEVLSTALDALRCAGLRAVLVLAEELESAEASERRAAARMLLQAWSSLRDDMRETGRIDTLGVSLAISD